MMKNKANIVFWVILYLIAFSYVLTEFIVPIFGYLGRMELVAFTFNKALTTFFCIILPIIWLPQKITRPTQTIFWYIYVLIHIPTLITVLNCIDRDFYKITCFFLIGNAIIGYSYTLPLLNIEVKSLKLSATLRILVVILTLICIAIFFKMGSKLSFANPFDSDAVYDQRLREDIDLGWLNYPMVLANSLILPLLFLYGIHKKEWKFLLIGVLAQIFLYMIYAHKSFMFTIFMILTVYYVINKENTGFGLKLLRLFAVLTSVSGAYLLIQGYETKNLFSNIALLLIIRTVGIGVINFMLYYDFFINLGHPLTYLSHVNIVGKFIKYPYEKQLGVPLGEFYFKSSYNPNANFIITDGICAFGLPGIVVACTICAFFFFLNRFYVNKTQYCFFVWIIYDRSYLYS